MTSTAFREFIERAVAVRDAAREDFDTVGGVPPIIIAALIVSDAILVGADQICAAIERRGSR